MTNCRRAVVALDNLLSKSQVEVRLEALGLREEGIKVMLPLTSVLTLLPAPVSSSWVGPWVLV